VSHRKVARKGSSAKGRQRHQLKISDTRAKRRPKIKGTNDDHLDALELDRHLFTRHWHRPTWRRWT
jgi:hypothetical protein